MAYLHRRWWWFCQAVGELQGVTPWPLGNTCGCPRNLGGRINNNNCSYFVQWSVTLHLTLEWYVLWFNPDKTQRNPWISAACAKCSVSILFTCWLLQQSKDEFALFWNIPVNQLKWLKKNNFWVIKLKFSSGPRGNGKGCFFCFCLFTAFCRVWLSLFPCRGPAMRLTNLFNSEWKLWNAQMFGIHPTRLLSQVAVISCRWPTTTTATGRVCSHPKNWRVLNLEHDVTSFEMGGTTSIIDPLRARRRWVIERRSISDRNPKTSAAQLPKQRLFLPRRLTAHSLICHVSPPSPVPSLFSWSMASPAEAPERGPWLRGLLFSEGRFLAVRWVPVQDVGLFKTRTVLHSTATNFSLWIYMWS